MDLADTYSLLANLLAVPLMGLWIMPWGLLALVLMPLGFESLALVPMGEGIALVNGIARFVSGLPGSTMTVPPRPYGLWCARASAVCLSASGKGMAAG